MAAGPVRSICIVGGGTAGWLTAGILAARHGAGSGLQITLVESETIGIIGVGEGTWPTMRSTLKKIGHLGNRVLPRVQRLVQAWREVRAVGDGSRHADFYYHPLMLPEGFPSLDLAPFWMKYSEEHRDAPSFSMPSVFRKRFASRGSRRS